MEDGEDWLLRPVLKGMCKYESLVTPGLDLQDIALMNEAIDIEAENEYRLRRAAEASARAKTPRR